MSLSDLFLFCFALGSIWALVALLLGGVRIGHFGHSHVHVGHSQIGHAAHGQARLAAGQHHGAWGHLVNPSCIAIFLSWGGGAGYLLLLHAHLALWFDFSLASVAGLTGAGVLARFLDFLQSRERVLDPADYEMVGTLGQVSCGIRPSGIGEVIYVRDGARRAVPARSEDGVAIDRGVEVIVLRYEHGIAYVRSWDAMAHLPEPSQGD